MGPLPVWKETKSRIQEQLSESLRANDVRTREWEQKEQVLGHTQKANFHKPREILSVTRMWDSAGDADDTANAGGNFHQFSSRVWTMRQAIQRGYEALYTVQV